MARSSLLVVVVALSTGCSAMLPSSREVTASGSGWQRYEDAENTFDQIVPGKTTLADLRGLNLDPATNPSVTLVHHSLVRQRFIPNPLVTLDDLDPGVRECVVAREKCRAYEVNYVASQTKRTGNAALDLIKVYRETQTAGWRFNGLILTKDGVVLYKLTAGQPRILTVEQKQDVLGPVQALSSRLNLDGLKDQVASLRGKNDPAPGAGGADAPVLGVATLKRP